MGVQRELSQATTGDITDSQHGREANVVFGAGRLLVVFPGDACDVEFVYNNARPNQMYTYALDSTSVVMVSQERVAARFALKRECKLMDEGDFCCILAFVDAAIDPTADKPANHAGVCCQKVPEDAIESTEQLGHWLTLEVMQGEASNALLHHLRKQESYTLASYLMQSPVDGAHLNELCVEYGLSYSHFRRLCRRSLGSAIKARLRTWRAARTVLDIIDSNQSILQIAVGNGYTSASHVSTDIKQLFGFTPRAARNARNLLP